MKFLLSMLTPILTRTLHYVQAMPYTILPWGYGAVNAFLVWLDLKHQRFPCGFLCGFAQ